MDENIVQTSLKFDNAMGEAAPIKNCLKNGVKTTQKATRKIAQKILAAMAKNPFYFAAGVDGCC
jgi:hypothetical protein